MSVTSTYYGLLHSLEEEGSLDPTNCLHLFSAQYVFMPRLTSDLHTFINSWNNHPLRTEQNLTPNELWDISKALNPVPSADSAQHTLDQNVPSQDEDLVASGIVVPLIACPLTQQNMELLRATFNPTAPSCDFGRAIYICFKFCSPSQYYTCVKYQHVKMCNLYKAHTMLSFHYLLFIIHLKRFMTTLTFFSNQSTADRLL